MRDALGGVVNLVIIVFFIVIALGYLAFNVNYTKAFRMKDKVIATMNKFNGDCAVSCMEDDDCETLCLSQIVNYAKEIGYSNKSLECSMYGAGFQNSNNLTLKLSNKNVNTNFNNLFCYKKVTVSTPSSSYYKEGVCRYYFEIITTIYTDLPIVNKVFEFANQSFTIKGNTKIFTARC